MTHHHYGDKWTPRGFLSLLIYWFIFFIVPLTWSQTLQLKYETFPVITVSFSQTAENLTLPVGGRSSWCSECYDNLGDCQQISLQKGKGAAGAQPGSMKPPEDSGRFTRVSSLQHETKKSHLFRLLRRAGWQSQCDFVLIQKLIQKLFDHSAWSA